MVGHLVAAMGESTQISVRAKAHLSIIVRALYIPIAQSAINGFDWWSARLRLEVIAKAMSALSFTSETVPSSEVGTTLGVDFHHDTNVIWRLVLVGIER
jgi:hypothetical protein